MPTTTLIITEEQTLTDLHTLMTQSVLPSPQDFHTWLTAHRQHLHAIADRLTADIDFVERIHTNLLQKARVAAILISPLALGFDTQGGLERAMLDALWALRAVERWIRVVVRRLMEARGLRFSEQGL
jgi:hypothetical protein